ncbi:hypothetical protein BpHYR1_005550 [Brachionus plicatilis]|uniref:Uncharacterized protein n=1 Tax=Brachionus plicatilis TaxID=10195 RepID=A0A3M7SG60_BRAPC|nr:hypothetical protein BpHYR1_005550 [Brachionus plicatilis]
MPDEQYQSYQVNQTNQSEPNFFFQNKYLINFFSCVYLSSHTVSPYPLIFSSGLGTGNGMIATQQSKLHMGRSS